MRAGAGCLEGTTILLLYIHHYHGLKSNALFVCSLFARDPHVRLGPLCVRALVVCSCPFWLRPLRTVPAPLLPNARVCVHMPSLCVRSLMRLRPQRLGWLPASGCSALLLFSGASRSTHNRDPHRSFCRSAARWSLARSWARRLVVGVRATRPVSSVSDAVIIARQFIRSSRPVSRSRDDGG